MFSDELLRITTCVSKAKKFFKNTRKRKHRYQKYLKDKYSFSGKKEIKHFPIPVMTRWGSWRKAAAAVYICDYLEDIEDFAKSVPRKESPEAVEYFQNLTELDIKIIHAEAMFVREYCTPVSDMLLELESSCKAMGHVLYPELNDLCKPFETLKLSTDVMRALNEQCKKFIDDLDLPLQKFQHLGTRVRQVAEKCHDIITKYMSEDPAKHIFRSLTDLFNPTKIVLGSVSESDILKAKRRINLFDNITDDQFKVLHDIFSDHVRDILIVKPNLGTAAVLRALEAMRGNYSEFVKKCLQSIYIPVANVDSERGFSAYGDVFSPKRTRLSKENVEVMMCLYFGDDPNNNVCDVYDENECIENDDIQMEDEDDLDGDE